MQIRVYLCILQEIPSPKYYDGSRIKTDINESINETNTETRKEETEYKYKGYTDQIIVPATMYFAEAVRIV